MRYTMDTAAIQIVDGSELFEPESNEARGATAPSDASMQAVAAKAPGSRDRQKKKKK